MPRTLGLVLLLFAASPAAAQFAAVSQHFADPTVWASGRAGMITWTADPYSPSTDELMSGVSVGVASPRWALQLGYLESDRIQLNLSGFSLSREGSGVGKNGTDPPVYDAPEVEPYAALTFHTAYLAAGPIFKRKWVFATMAAGPAVTWGTRARYERRACISNCPYPGRVRTDRVRNGYTRLGLTGQVEGGVRLDGRVWLGLTSAVVLNGNSAHASTSLALRVDLLRPDR